MIRLRRSLLSDNNKFPPFFAVLWKKHIHFCDQMGRELVKILNKKYQCSRRRRRRYIGVDEVGGPTVDEVEAGVFQRPDAEQARIGQHLADVLPAQIALE
jgi:hypothetical protein